MRKVAMAALAVPVLATVYAPAVFRRALVLRLGVALMVGALLGVLVLGVLPTPTTATPPQPTDVPVGEASFGSVLKVDAGLDSQVTLTFTTTMDQSSVEDALSVEPAVPVELSWAADARSLTVRPRDRWSPGTYHTISVAAGARDQAGSALARPVRAAFLTRGLTTARFERPALVRKRVAPDTAFRIVFSRRVLATTAESALTIEPEVDGETTVTNGPGEGSTISFTPAEPLTPGSTYRVHLDATIRDIDGGAITSPPDLEVTVIDAPTVVRFRPAGSTADVAREATLSVRFSTPMDRAATARAFSASIGGTKIAGRTSWAEGNTVLVFDPATTLPYGTQVVLSVDSGARSAAGTALGRVRTVRFTTVKKPVPVRRALARPTPPRPKPTPKPKPKPKPGGGGAVGSGAWAGVETYYLRLMNCTRTGGLVNSSGDCRSPGGRNVSPLRLDAGISSKVSRPYARLLATRAQCDHFIGGTPGDRLRRAGYRGSNWGENLGCRSGNAYTAVLGSHLYFQSERSYNGGHYRNLMNGSFDRVGIGVWVSGGRVRIVIDFYNP